MIHKLRPSQGFWGFREKGFFIFRDLVRMVIYFQGFGEKGHLFSGIWGESITFGGFRQRPDFRELGRKVTFLSGSKRRLQTNPKHFEKLQRRGFSLLSQTSVLFTAEVSPKRKKEIIFHFTSVFPEFLNPLWKPKKITKLRYVDLYFFKHRTKTILCLHLLFSLFFPA